MHFPRSSNWLMMRQEWVPTFWLKPVILFTTLMLASAWRALNHLCRNWHESHFLLIEVSGCLHTLRLVRAALTAGLYARALSSAQSAAEVWEAKCWCSSFDRSLKASLCCLWLLSCAMIIVVCNVLKHCIFSGCNLNKDIIFGTILVITTHASILRWQYGSSQANIICIIGLKSKISRIKFNRSLKV